MKKWRVLLLLFIFGFSYIDSYTLQIEDLSPEAREFVSISGGGPVRVTLRDGRSVEGIVILDTPDKIVIRVKHGPTVTASSSYSKTDIKSIEPLDLEPQFAEKLLQLEPQPHFEEIDYEKTIKLFEEFLEKCKNSPHYSEVEKRKKIFDEGLERLRKGLVFINGEWVTPMCAAIIKFDEYSMQMAELRKTPEYARRDPRVIAAYEQIAEQRIELVRDLPRKLQQQIPYLLSKKEFDSAAETITSFIQFWMTKVMSHQDVTGYAVEEKIREMFQGTDFSRIIEIEKEILNSYKESGKGKTEEKPKISVPDDMVFIPGGFFLMGNPSGKVGDDNFPARLVYVSPFLIDKYEVSNAQYRKFVEYVKKTGDASMEHKDAPPLKDHTPVGWKYPELSGDDQPVVGVDWFDAWAYAHWAGKDLPTEAQWEKAARGLDTGNYPWGDRDPSKVIANWGAGRLYLVGLVNEPRKQKYELECKVAEQSGGCMCVKTEAPPPFQPLTLPNVTWRCDSLPSVIEDIVKEGLVQKEKLKLEDVSYYGVVNMAGNAAEWVRDYYDEKCYSTAPFKDPFGPDSGLYRVYRGGSYLSENPMELCVYKRFYARSAQQKKGCDDSGRPFVGFRCARYIDLIQPPEPKKEKAMSFEEIMKELEKERELKKKKGR